MSCSLWDELDHFLLVQFVWAFEDYGNVICTDGSFHILSDHIGFIFFNAFRGICGSILLNQQS